MLRQSFLSLTVCCALLGGCAANAVHTGLKPELRGQIKATDVVTGIKQNELYAAFVPSAAGASAAAGCGAVPGLGILLAGVCGGIAGAADASINASRASAAEASVRPLKDALIDFSFDADLQQALSSNLSSARDLNASKITVTKEVSDDAYNATLAASSASAVMFVNTDYHLSPDFSTLVIQSQSLLYPRAAALRAAVGQSQDPAADSEGKKATDVSNAIYRNTVVYEARLPAASTELEANVTAWGVNQADPLRKALKQGIREVTAALRADLQHMPAISEAGQSPANTIEVDRQQVVLVSQSPSGKLVRYKDGTLKYIAEMSSMVIVDTTAAAPSSPAAP